MTRDCEIMPKRGRSWDPRRHWSSSKIQSLGFQIHGDNALKISDVYHLRTENLSERQPIKVCKNCPPKIVTWWQISNRRMPSWRRQIEEFVSPNRRAVAPAANEPSSRTLFSTRVIPSDYTNLQVLILHDNPPRWRSAHRHPPRLVRMVSQTSWNHADQDPDDSPDRSRSLGLLLVSPNRSHDFKFSEGG